MKTLGRIKQVEAEGDYCIIIVLDNGSSISLNLESRLRNIRFGCLADKEFFRTVQTDGDFIRWGYKVEISLSEVFQMAQK